MESMKAKISFGIFLIFFTYSLPVLSQATAYANIYAEVVAPVGINNTSALHSGEIVVSKTPKTIGTLDETSKSVRDAKIGQNGSVTLISFSITDAQHSTFDITLPTTMIGIGDNHSNVLTVSNFTSNQALASVSQGNKRTITVGADFNFHDHPANRNFQSQNQIPVTINYN